MSIYVITFAFLSLAVVTGEVSRNGSSKLHDSQTLSSCSKRLSIRTNNPFRRCLLSSFQAACSLCPDGGNIDFPDRTLPLQDRVLTCGELQADLQPTSEASTRSGETCQPSMDVTVLNSIFDLASFCGCLGHSPPGVCSLCGDSDSSVIDFDKEIPGIEAGADNPTCGDVDELAQFVTNTAFCDSIFQNFGSACCNNRDRCSICPHGTTMAEPNTRLDFVGGKTCSDLDSDLSFTPANQCDSTRMALYQILDLETACQCRSVSEFNQDGCNLCRSDGDLLDRGYYSLNYEIPGTDSWTCESAYELAPLTTEDECDELIVPLSLGCCKSSENERCSLCPDGNPVGQPKKKLAINGQQVTCGELDFNLGFLLDGESECQEAHEEYEDLPFEVTSYCGCPNVQVPDVCTLCGDNFAIINSEWKVLLTGLTCGESEDFARHVTDDDYCRSQVAAIGGQCCLKRVFEPVDMPSPSPNSGAEVNGLFSFVNLLMGATIVVLLEITGSQY